MKYKIQKTDEEWKKLLSPEAYRVLRQSGTERAFTGEYTDTEDTGTYHCAGCNFELFSSENKFHSGCGWPSFWAPADGAAIEEETDSTLGMVRTEVMCDECGAHLGHVFPDGPQDRGGLRYCINSASLRFVHRDDMAAEGYGDYINQVEDVT